MNEYVDVDIIENGKVIGTTKVLHVTKEPETQNIKLEKVGAKTAYDNLLIKYAELEKEIRLLGERCNQLLKDKGELEQQIEQMKCCYNCSKDCGSIDRRICFENKMKDWVMKGGRK